MCDRYNYGEIDTFFKSFFFKVNSEGQLEQRILRLFTGGTNSIRNTMYTVN